MPSACLQEIVTLGACPDDGQPKSGFTLLRAPGISQKVLDNIASETYVQGSRMAMEKKALTLTQVTNDFVGALQANKVIASLVNTVYNTSAFRPLTSVGTYAGERGVTIYKASGPRSRLRQTYIEAVQCYPLTSGPGQIVIYDGYHSTAWDVDFVAGKVNTFGRGTLEGFPFVIPADSAGAKVRIDQTTVEFAQSNITCLKGCNGAMPNPCGWADGWNGSARVKKEGYGINVQFYCACNYEQILCDLSNSYVGEIIWLKWQINVMEEHLRTSRFNSWVTYNRKELTDEVIPDLESKYTQKWNELMAGLPGILKGYRDDCLQCNGIRWVTNL